MSRKRAQESDVYLMTLLKSRYLFAKKEILAEMVRENNLTDDLTGDAAKEVRVGKIVNKCTTKFRVKYFPYFTRRMSMGFVDSRPVFLNMVPQNIVRGSEINT